MYIEDYVKKMFAKIFLVYVSDKYTIQNSRDYISN